MTQMFTDIRHAARGLAKQPRFTIVATLTLALGVGLVTAIFSVVNAVLLKPLPYPRADRLVNVWSTAPGLGYDQFGLSPDLYFLYRAESRAFEDMAMSQGQTVNVTGAGEPDVAPARLTTASYLTTFGITPVTGANFTERDDQPGAPRVAMISHRLWQRKFSGAAGVVGQRIQINGEPTTIVGVLPAWLDSVGSPDMLIPARLNANEPPVGSFQWQVAGRLAPGVTAAAAEASLVPLLERVRDRADASDNYRAFLVNGRYRNLVQDMKAAVIGNVERPLWILLGTVGGVLLIVCANVANLCLMRADGRRREIAVRSALGAPRARLVREQLVEAGVLAAIGGAAGVALAAAALPALIRLAPATIPRLHEVGLDPRVLAVSAAAAALAALIFGLAPAVRYTRFTGVEVLRQGGRGATADRARHRGRQLLVVVQTAMTLVLLVGSGLLARSFARMVSADLGFEPDRVLTFRLTLPASSYGDAQTRAAFEQRLLERLMEVPGVEAAGATSHLPIAASAPGTAHLIDGRTVEPGQLPPMIHYSVVSPGYFESMRMPLQRGRLFDSRDRIPDARTVVINRALADKFWPGEDPIGKRLQPLSETGPGWFTVIGVVAPVLHNGVREPAPALVYYPPSGIGDNPLALTYTVRGRDRLPDAAAVRSAVWALDASLPLAVMQPLDEVVTRSFVQFTFTAVTLGIAAVTGLILGAIGLYGVLSYAVTLRTRDIGVRLALGASPGTVMRAVVVQGLAVAAIGLVLGLLAAAGLTRLLAGLLYDVKALDVPTFVTMSAVLLAVALIASFLPARRAASVSPLESLRAE